MAHIQQEKKTVMNEILGHGEKQLRNFRSVAADFFENAPSKLTQRQREKARQIAKETTRILTKDLPQAQKYIKKHYTPEDWERDKKLVDDILVIGTTKIVLHCQEILNQCNGMWGATLNECQDKEVVPTVKLAMTMIRTACDMVNYTSECLSEAFHDDWDMIVEIEDIITPKALEKYKKAVTMLDEDLRKCYESKKKAMELKYGQAIHRSKCPDVAYYIPVEEENKEQ